jgi:hypothetical protein
VEAVEAVETVEAVGDQEDVEDVEDAEDAEDVEDVEDAEDAEDVEDVEAEKAEELKQDNASFKRRKSQRKTPSARGFHCYNTDCTNGGPEILFVSPRDESDNRPPGDLYCAKCKPKAWHQSCTFVDYDLATTGH